MSPVNLLRRKTQLELLAVACEARRAARVTTRSGNPRVVACTRLLALEAERLLLECPTRTPGALAGPDVPVEVFFDYGDDRFACATTTIGRAWWREAGHTPRAVWRLAVPLTIVRKQQREAYRLRLNDVEPVHVCCTNIATNEECRARLMNISMGGLGLLALDEDAKLLRGGETYWVNFALPDEVERFEFVARLVHVRPTPRRDGVIAGGAFCASDDVALHAAQMQRIQAFLTDRQRCQLRRLSQQREDTGE